MARWVVIHVVPLNDLHPHAEVSRPPVGSPIGDLPALVRLITNCPCHPYAEQVGPRKIRVTHQAFDGRDLIEQHGVN